MTEGADYRMVQVIIGAAGYCKDTGCDRGCWLSQRTGCNWGCRLL